MAIEVNKISAREKCRVVVHMRNIPKVVHHERNPGLQDAELRLVKRVEHTQGGYKHLRYLKFVISKSGLNLGLATL